MHMTASISEVTGWGSVGVLDWEEVGGANEEERQLLTQEQYGEAFRQGYPTTLRFLLSRGAPPDIAEEMAQAAWVKGWECRIQLQKPEMIGAWVNSIAKNMLKNKLRSEQRLERLTDTARAGTPQLGVVDVRRMMQDGDRRDITILFGHYLEGYTTEELAGQVGMTPVTVRVRLLRIRRALRSKLTKRPRVRIPAVSAECQVA
jgi:DNA-directed RNA polymerase specialized sigma24 family protein